MGKLFKNRNVRLLMLWLALVVFFTGFFRALDLGKSNRQVTFWIILIATVSTFLGAFVWNLRLPIRLQKQLQRGDFRGAITTIECWSKNNSIKYFPELALILSYNLAVCHFLLGEFDKAKSILSTLISQNIDQTSVKGKSAFLSIMIPRMYAWTLVFSGENSMEAIDFLDTQMEKSGRPIFRKLKGYMEFLKGNHTEGASLMGQSLEIEEDLSKYSKEFVFSAFVEMENKFLKGFYLLKIGNLEEAITILTNVKEFPISNCLSLKASELLDKNYP